MTRRLDKKTQQRQSNNRGARNRQDTDRQVRLADKTRLPVQSRQATQEDIERIYGTKGVQ